MSFNPICMLLSSIWVAEKAKAAGFVLMPSSFINVSGRHNELAFSRPFLVLPFTIIIVSLEPFHNSYAILLPLHPLAFILSSTHFNWFFHYSPAVSFVVLPSTMISCAIGPYHETLTLSYIVLPLTNVASTIFRLQSPLAIPLTILI